MNALKKTPVKKAVASKDVTVKTVTARPAAKSIVKAVPKAKTIKSLELKVKIQTAEGWKRGAIRAGRKK